MTNTDIDGDNSAENCGSVHAFLPFYGNLHAKNVRKENLRYVTQRSACRAVRCNRTVRWRTVCAKPVRPPEYRGPLASNALL
ncbi:hypothetical protein PUV44_03130 [Xanthomonas arboricola pv. corylina]|nr:hypothetical protein PUV44_03130 [Xanthomonas arboricola pv. corylina]